MSAIVVPSRQLLHAIRRLEILQDRPGMAMRAARQPAYAMLLATIPAQIKLLREAADYAIDWEAASLEDRGPQPARIYRLEIELASAINSAKSIAPKRVTA